MNDNICLELTTGVHDLHFRCDPPPKQVFTFIVAEGAHCGGTEADSYATGIPLADGFDLHVVVRSNDAIVYAFTR